MKEERQMPLAGSTYELSDAKNESEKLPVLIKSISTVKWCFARVRKGNQ